MIDAVQRGSGAVTEGTVLANKYRLIAELGKGGMGVVWRAEDVRLPGAPVAVKLLHPRDAANPELRARFEAEARTAARLRGSPHIVQVLDVGVNTDGTAPFIAMELLEGESLRERLSRTGTLSWAELARVVWDVARGLTRAHELGVVHRDLKPSNIFLVRNLDSEVAKVLDFGIAKRTAGSLHHAPTATGTLLGTPMYMSPEQIVSSRDVDLRADLWSLAVIAVECLTGKMPFEADNLPGLALLICQGHSTLPSRLGLVPPGFDRWFERATQLAPEQRFGSAMEMADELRQLCAGAPAPTAEHAASVEARVPEPQALRQSSSLSLSSTITRRPAPGKLWRSSIGGRVGVASLLLLLGLTGYWLWRRPGQLDLAPVSGESVLVAGSPHSASQLKVTGSSSVAPVARVAASPVVAPVLVVSESSIRKLDTASRGAAGVTASVPADGSPTVRVLEETAAVAEGPISPGSSAGAALAPSAVAQESPLLEQSRKRKQLRRKPTMPPPATPATPASEPPPGIEP